MSRRHRASKFALCMDNRRYRTSLIIHKLYRVIPDLQAEKHGMLRVIDETGEDYLYSRERFARLDIPPSLRQKLIATGG